MEKERNTKIIAIAALVVAVVGLSIGFAAYSRSLDITDIEAGVSTEDTELDVFFDNDTTKSNELAVVKGVGAAAVTNETGAVINNVELNSNSDTNPTISNFRAAFTEKGQEVTYTFYVYNNSAHTAYLESANFLTADPDHKTCEAVGNVDATNLEHACEEINMYLEIGDAQILSTKGDSFASHSIAAGEWKEVVVRIAYDGTQYSLPDGDMKVIFDGIRLGYTTIKQD